MHAAARRPPLVVLIAASGLGPLALNVLLPSLPGIQHAFDRGYDTVQLALSLYLVGFAVAQLLYGPASDRFGRRPALLVGLLLFLGGSVVGALAPSIEVLIAGRIVQAVGGCAGIVMGRAIIRDHYGPEHAASMLGYVTMAMVVAPMLGPVIGGYLDVWFGWRAGFVFVTAFGLLVLAGAAYRLGETHRPPDHGVSAGVYAASLLQLLRMPAFCGYAFFVGFTSSIFFAFLSGSPYVMVELLRRPANEFGLYFIAVSIFYMAGNLAAGRYSVRVGSDRMIGVGTTIAIIGTVALAVAAAAGEVTALTMFGAMSVIAVANGMSMPNAIAAGVGLDPRRIGAASGLIGFLQMAAGAVTSFVVGALIVDSATPMVAVMLAGGLLAAGAFGLALRSRRSAVAETGAAE